MTNETARKALPAAATDALALHTGTGDGFEALRWRHKLAGRTPDPAGGVELSAACFTPRCG